jgi:hypothetical protein
MFVRAWTSRVRHFSNSSTLRLEGGHSSLKQFIRDSRRDILTVCEKIVKYSKNQHTLITLILGQSESRPSNTIKNVKQFSPGLYNMIVPMVLRKALKQISLGAQYVKNNTIKPCTGSFKSIYGVPCYHSILTVDATGRTLTEDDFHLRWHFSRFNLYFNTQPSSQYLQLLLLPHIVQRQGSNHLSGTGRKLTG